MTRSRTIVATATLTLLGAATLAATASTATTTTRSQATQTPVTAHTPVRSCPADFRHLDRNGQPTRKVRVPATVTRPVGLRLPTSMALYGVANDRRLPRAAYQTLAGPTGFACSGMAVSQDDVSWASFRSRTAPSHSITATFMQGQESFPAMCTYLLADHRRHEARVWAKTFGATLRQCRRWTDDAPASATLHPVAVTPNRRGPIVLVIHAPKGSELTGHALDPRGRSLPQHRTTTPTVSVAILSFTSTKSYSWPQTLDCSVPAAQRTLCRASAAVFVDQALRGSFRWGARGAAHAAEKVADSIR